MQPDLSILNAMQYDIGIPRTATTRATRGSKRKITASTPRALEATDSPGRHSSSHNLASMTADDSVAPEDEILQSSETKKKKLKRPAKPLSLQDSDDGEGDGDAAELEREGGKKRARGRPRIDIKDVTAVDVSAMAGSTSCLETITDRSCRDDEHKFGWPREPIATAKSG